MKRIITFHNSDEAEENINYINKGNEYTITDISVAQAGGTNEEGEAYILKSIIVTMETP
jgi:hypothetical protein